MKISDETMGFMNRIMREIISITIEPVLFFFILSLRVDYDAQITTSLLIRKVCRFELNYTEDICSNLTLDEYQSVNEEVQKEVVDIQSVGVYLGSGPALIYSLFVGSLSDDFGRKPLMLLPLIGVVLTDVALLLNYLFIEQLPVQFFYVDRIWQLFGGGSVFYLGSYGYLASITSSNDRAYRLARADGVDTVSAILGKGKLFQVSNEFEFPAKVKSQIVKN